MATSTSRKRGRDGLNQPPVSSNYATWLHTLLVGAGIPVPEVPAVILSTPNPVAINHPPAHLNAGSLNLSGASLDFMVQEGTLAREPRAQSFARDGAGAGAGASSWRRATADNYGSGSREGSSASSEGDFGGVHGSLQLSGGAPQAKMTYKQLCEAIIDGRIELY